MKVNLSKSTHKKSYFPIDLDSSTTTNFGEVLPLFCHELVPQSHASVKIHDAVRFAPLSFPTFGKAFLKNYVFCHKISDLYPPFNDMLAQTPYTTSSGTTYIPSSVPHLPLWVLWLSVVCNSSFTFYHTDFSGIKEYTDGTNPFIVTDIPFSIIDKVYTGTTGGKQLTEVEISLSLFHWLRQSLANKNNSIIGDEAIVSASFGGANNLNNIIYNNMATNLSSVYAYDEYDETDTPEISHSISTRVTPQSADYIFYLPLQCTGYYSKDSNGNVVYNNSVVRFTQGSNSNGTVVNNIMVCMRLNDSGKFLRKLFMGLGYQVAPLDTTVSILPIYAYFKSYFETFAPKRFVKFEQTYFSRFMNRIITTGATALNLCYDVNIGWNTIIDDLLSCYYTKNTDYYSAQIIGLINDYGGDLSQSYLGVYAEADDMDEFNVERDRLESNVTKGAVPSVNFKNEIYSMNHTQNQQNILSRLTQFVNRRSVAGAKIASVLKSVFGISSKEVEEYNAYVGSNSIDVNFGDVFSTAETAEASLGEYAGKAIGVGSSDTFNINVDTHSLIFGISVVVPRTQYVQGVNPILTHVDYDSFYNPMFDGLTLLPTRKSALYTGNGNLVNIDNDKSFGNLPIYSEYKTKSCGILSGDLSLNSTKSTYDSFTMDEIISSSTLVTPSSGDIYTGLYSNVDLSPKALVAGTMWRYLGRWLWLGRFDRIFVNNRLSLGDFVTSILPPDVDGSIQSTRNLVRSDDNLIVHHVVNMKINAPMVPLSGSWMTDDMLALDSYGIEVQSE